ncbi:MAG: hypothetical protein ABSD82_06285 [Solirubrobacteraceae bacterium]|jgi:hypothetical protein
MEGLVVVKDRNGREGGGGGWWGVVGMGWMDGWGLGMRTKRRKKKKKKKKKSKVIDRMSRDVLG